MAVSISRHASGTTKNDGKPRRPNGPVDRVRRRTTVFTPPESSNSFSFIRYGIRSAYDPKMTSPVFQTAIESLDRFTQAYDYPVNETTGFRGKMKVVKDEGEGEEEEDTAVDLDAWEFDWERIEVVLAEGQGE